MKNFAVALGILSLLSGAFVAGAWYGRKPDEAHAAAHHAAHAPPPPGTVSVSAAQQQLIGVMLGEVQEGESTFTRRLVGRVAVDETRVYRSTVAVDAWIQEIFPVTVGTLVKKDQPLLSFYSPEFLGPSQAYFFALGALDRYQQSGAETPAQMALTRASVQQATDSLKNLGMGDLQIEELKRTRQLTQKILLRAPATGFVIARNVFPGQRLERNAELYRIADLRRVWIVADLFENEADSLRPGSRVKVSLPQQQKTLEARVSQVLPQFDPISRVLRVRLEADNPGYALRPDMFVDVDLPVRLPSAVTVPVDAVHDSGLTKRVFVDRGGGFFEPRAVETGWRIGDRVQVLRGLAPGERIVVSGTFLVDSESRMRLGGADQAAAPAHHHDHADPPAPARASAAGEPEHAGHRHD